MTLLEIGIRRHQVEGRVGVLPHEKLAPQPLFIDISVRYDATRAIDGDDLSEAVDYTELIALVDRLIAKGHYHLIETLAAHLLGELLKAVKKIQWAKVRIEKPLFGSYVEVESQ